MARDIGKILLERSETKQESIVVDGDIDVIVRGVTTDEWLKFGELRDHEWKDGAIYLLQRCVIDDEEGEPVLTEEVATQIVNKSPRIFQPIMDKILSLSGFGQQNKPDARGTDAVQDSVGDRATSVDDPEAASD